MTWSVNGVAGGNASVGTISAAGAYVAPEFPPTGGAVTITAVETADATKTADSAVTLENPVPQVASIAPASIPVGAFTLTVNGAHFATGAAVQFGSAMLTTTRVSSTKLTATGTATSAQVGNVSVMVKNPDPGTVNSGSGHRESNRRVRHQRFAYSSHRHHSAWRQHDFRRHRNGHNESGCDLVGGQRCVWNTHQRVHEYPTANYAPPGIVPNPNIITITATSVADPTKKASSTVTLVNPTPVLTTH